MIRKVLIPIFVIGVLSSCSVNTENRDKIVAELSRIYGTENIEVIEGMSSGTKSGVHPYVEVKLNGGEFINEADSSDDIQNCASMIALVTYDNLDKTDLKDDLTFDIEIVQNLQEGNKTYTAQYPIKDIQNVYQCYNTLNSIFSTFYTKDYSKTYDF